MGEGGPHSLPTPRSDGPRGISHRMCISQWREMVLIPSHPHLPSSIEIIASVTPTECATARLVENRQHRVPSIEGYLASVECLDGVSLITPGPLSDSIHHVLSRTREPRDDKERGEDGWSHRKCWPCNVSHVLRKMRLDIEMDGLVPCGHSSIYTRRNSRSPPSLTLSNPPAGSSTRWWIGGRRITAFYPS